MNENNKEQNFDQHDDWKNHPWHHGHYGRHFALRWILGLIILAIVFCVGVKVGEFKAALWGGGYGSPYFNHHMRNMPYGSGMMYQSYGPGPDMMYNYQTVPLPTDPQGGTAVPSPTAIPKK